MGHGGDSDIEMPGREDRATDGAEDDHWDRRDEDEDGMDGDQADKEVVTEENVGETLDTEQRVSSSSDSSNDDSDEWSGVDSMRRDGDAMYCSDCQIWLHGLVQWQDHRIGRKHGQNMKRAWIFGFQEEDMNNDDLGEAESRREGDEIITMVDAENPRGGGGQNTRHSRKAKRKLRKNAASAQTSILPQENPRHKSCSRNGNKP